MPTMAKKEFVQEHKHLVKVLREKNGSSDRKREASKQESELKEIKRSERKE